MKALGCHILAEFSNCDRDILKDISKVKQIMVQAALSARTEIRETAFHKFSPHGVSGVIVIAESHLSIHTWPEYGYAAVDIYTCGNNARPWKACEYIAKAFASKFVAFTEIKRGVPDSSGRYVHKISLKKIASKGGRLAKDKKLAVVC